MPAAIYPPPPTAQPPMPPQQAPPPVARTRRVVWHRTWGTGCLLLSVGLMLLGLGSLLTLPDKIDDHRAYLAAEPCQGAAATSRELAADEPCLYTFTATVLKTEKAGRGTSGRQYKVTVRTEDDDHRLLGRFDDDPLAEDLQANDTLTVVTYRDEIFEFTRGAVRQQDTGTPVTKPFTHTAMGISLLTAGGWTFFIGLCAVAGARRMARYGRRAVLPRLIPPAAITVLVPVALAVPARGAVGSEPVLAALGAWLAVLVITLIAFRKRLRPQWQDG